MPVSIKNVGGKYRVSTPHGVKAKHTTKAKAEKQKRLLNAVEHGWKPTGKPVRESMVKHLATRLLSTLLEGPLKDKALDRLYTAGWNEEPHNLEPDDPGYRLLIRAYNQGIRDREKAEAEDPEVGKWAK